MKAERIGLYIVTARLAFYVNAYDKLCTFMFMSMEAIVTKLICSFLSN